jgi:putative phage-type endonuclease
MKQGTEEWFKARVGKVTASNVGAILGFSEYQTADDVMRSMVRDALGAEREFNGNIATQWGTDHEKEALAALEADTGLFIETCGLIVHPEMGWLGASPDGLTENAVIEVKCPYSQKHIDPKERLDYYSQVQVQMFCTGKNDALFASWTPDSLEKHALTLDPLWIKASLPKLQAFHEKYLEIVNDPELAAPYLEDLVQDMSVDKEWSELANIYLEHKAKVEGHKLSMEQAKKALIEMANGKKSQGGGLLVYPIKPRQTVNYKKAIKDNVPDLDLDGYTKTGEISWGVKEG